MPEAGAELLIDTEELLYRTGGGGLIWSLRIEYLLLIAEYTTNEGPWLDDYFLVFWTCEAGALFRAQCPLTANASEVMSVLGRHLESELSLLLFNRTEWDSRVIWPHTLAGEDYFGLKPAVGTNALTTAWYRMTDVQDYELSDRVRHHLKCVKV